MVVVAQSVRVSDCESEGRRFESDLSQPFKDIMNILILEDNNERIKQFRKNIAPSHLLFVTDDAEMAIEFLKEMKFDVLFLDHDLGTIENESTDNKNTGSEVARFLAANTDKIPDNIFLHSLSVPGRNYMNSLLPMAKQLPFAWTKVRIQ